MSLLFTIVTPREMGFHGSVIKATSESYIIENLWENTWLWLPKQIPPPSSMMAFASVVPPVFAGRRNETHWTQGCVCGGGARGWWGQCPKL